METEINKLKINNKLDIMIAIELLWVKLFDGWSCEKCNHIQGSPKKGVERYYCKHIPNLDNKLKPISKRITQEILTGILGGHIIEEAGEK